MDASQSCPLVSRTFQALAAPEATLGLRVADCAPRQTAWRGFGENSAKTSSRPPPSPPRVTHRHKKRVKQKVTLNTLCITEHNPFNDAPRASTTSNANVTEWQIPLDARASSPILIQSFNIERKPRGTDAGPGDCTQGEEVSRTGMRGRRAGQSEPTPAALARRCAPVPEYAGCERRELRARAALLAPNQRLATWLGAT